MAHRWMSWALRPASATFPRRRSRSAWTSRARCSSSATPNCRALATALSASRSRSPLSNRERFSSSTMEADSSAARASSRRGADTAVPRLSQRCADCLMGTAEGMRAYSMDLRERVVAAVDRGMTQEQAAGTFGGSVNTVGRYLTRRRNTGSLAPTAYRHGPRPEKTQRLQAWLPARLQVAADATLTEHAAAFTAEEGLVVSLATMSRAITTLPADDPAEALTPAGRRRRPGRPLKSKV